MKERAHPTVLDRLQKLWIRRANLATKSGVPGFHMAELFAFGWWFASGKFDDLWAVSQLKEVLKITQKVEPDHLVIERLATLVASMSLSVLECLSMLAEGDKEGWLIYGWDKNVRIILAAALQSTDDKARQAAKDLINRLGARGHLEFRNLLSSLE